MSRERNTTQMAMQVGKELAIAVTRVIERRRMTISEAMAYGCALALYEFEEPELASMMLDGRGTVPRYPHRHRVSAVIRGGTEGA